MKKLLTLLIAISCYTSIAQHDEGREIIFHEKITIKDSVATDSLTFHNSELGLLVRDYRNNALGGDVPNLAEVIAEGSTLPSGATISATGNVQVTASNLIYLSGNGAGINFSTFGGTFSFLGTPGSTVNMLVPLKVASIELPDGKIINDSTDLGTGGGGGSPPAAGDGIAVSGSTVSLDTTRAATQYDLTQLDIFSKNPSDLNQQSAANGQVLKWNGSAWVPSNDNTGGGGSSPTAGDGIVVTDTIVAIDTTRAATKFDIKVTSTDASLYISPSKELRGNVATKSDAFDWNTGDSKVFQLSRKPTKILYVTINGVVYNNPLTHYTINVSDSTVEVLLAMSNNYKVSIFYEHLIVATSTMANAVNIPESRAVELDQQIYKQILADFSAVSKPTLCLPDLVEVTVGTTIQLYKYPMVVAYNPSVYEVKVISDSIDGVDYIGDDYTRYWQFVPTGAGEFNIEVFLYDNTGFAVDSGAIAIKVNPAPVSPSSNVDVLFIGDSYTFHNRIPDEFARMAKSSDALVSNYNDPFSTNTVIKPAGLSLTNITLIGTQKNNPPSWTGTEFHEGYSGKTWNYFGYDATSPFVYSGAINFTQYLSDNGFTAPDVIYIGLGRNDISKIMTNPYDTDTVETDMKTFLDSIHSQMPSAKVYVWTQCLPSLNGGQGTHNFGSSPDVGVFRWKLAMTNLFKMYQEVANDAAYSGWVKVIGSHIMVDSENMMRNESVAKNSRITNLENRGTDEVHPSDGGYFQISDACLQSFFYNHCQ